MNEELIERFVAAAAEFRAACLAVRDPFKPVEPDGWNTHQLAAHTRDVDRVVYGMRVRRTLAEDNPVFKNFDADAYIAAHYDADEPLASILNELSASVKITATRLKTLPPETWARESRHVEFDGSFTLQTWFERGLAHIEEHLATVKTAR